MKKAVPAKLRRSAARVANLGHRYRKARQAHIRLTQQAIKNGVQVPLEVFHAGAPKSLIRHLARQR